MNRSGSILPPPNLRPLVVGCKENLLGEKSEGGLLCCNSLTVSLWGIEKIIKFWNYNHWRREPCWHWVIEVPVPNLLLLMAMYCSCCGCSISPSPPSWEYRRSRRGSVWCWRRPGCRRRAWWRPAERGGERGRWEFVERSWEVVGVAGPPDYWTTQPPAPVLTWPDPPLYPPPLLTSMTQQSALS